MIPPALSKRLDALILDGGVEAASIASILLAAKDSVERDYHVTLSRRVWAANDELLAEFERSAGGGCLATEVATVG
jgi:hypothetical protein